MHIFDEFVRYTQFIPNVISDSFNWCKIYLSQFNSPIESNALFWIFTCQLIRRMPVPIACVWATDSVDYLSVP